MTFWKLNIVAMLIGFVLDLLIGDPEGWPHPVIWIGRYISFLERRLRARGGNLRRSAVWLTGSTVLLSMAVTAAVLFVLSRFGKIPLLAGMSLISWTALSARCLAKEGKGVAQALRISLERGRKQVGRIVGRDTSELSEAEIIKATVETIAENTTDGVIAPMLYLILGGPVLAMGFKAASTLDSMVGYLDEKYRDIGWSSAKLDDVLNWIPARLCGLLMCACARPCGLDGRKAFRMMRRDHANHLSPNCAWSEAAMAGALHVQLGGTHLYFGKPVEKPTIGDDDRAIESEDILRANRLLYASSAVLAIAALIVGGLL
ncbi:MAG: adenosylcobinamide-phosphate synthase CbiB [Candidatus Faecivicinus sp.]